MKHEVYTVSLDLRDIMRVVDSLARWVGHQRGRTLVIQESYGLRPDGARNWRLAYRRDRSGD